MKYLLIICLLAGIIEQLIAFAHHAQDKKNYYHASLYGLKWASVFDILNDIGFIIALIFWIAPFLALGYCIISICFGISIKNQKDKEDALKAMQSVGNTIAAFRAIVLIYNIFSIFFILYFK